MEKSKLELLLKEEPLFMGDLSREFIDWPSLLASAHPSLFFGVGLCTSKEPANAIPFDILSFFFLAEKLRRELKLNTIFVLIADEHAKTNHFMTDEIIKKLSTQMTSTFTILLRNLHLRNFQIALSSDIHKNSHFQEILHAIPPQSNEYLRWEIADLTWFTALRNVRLKLGWSMNNDPTPQGHDERFFDVQIRNVKTLPLSFIHCKAGRTFDDHRPKVSPYISVSRESRILLSKNEQAKEKLVRFCASGKSETAHGAMHHLNLIVRLFETLFIRIPKPSLAEKIQFIIDLSTHS